MGTGETINEDHPASHLVDTRGLSTALKQKKLDVDCSLPICAEV
jgi:hypothetical protein